MKWLLSSGTLPVLAAVLLALSGLSCNQTAKPTTPATAAEKPKAEGELAFVTLDPDQVKSLRVATTKITPQAVQAHADLTGWVTPRQHHELVVKAEVAGQVLDPGKGHSLPLPGQRVEVDQLLFRLRPVLTSLEEVQFASLRVAADTEVEKASDALALAKQDFHDMKALVESKFKPKQELDRVETRLKHAQADHKLALKKKDLLSVTERDVKANRGGTAAIVHVSPGEFVPAGAPLVTLLDLDPVWVRVPLPEEDLPRLDRKQPAEVVLRTTRPDGGKGGTGGQVEAGKALTFRAELVAVVPVVDPGRHTLDVLYELKQDKDGPDTRGLFAKDLMVTVYVPLGEKRTESIVPYSAVVFDAHGGTSIYLDRGQAKSGKRQYERQRVEVGARIGDGVVVRPTLAAGDNVVTQGAAELFSREFYKPPVPR